MQASSGNDQLVADSELHCLRASTYNKRPIWLFSSSWISRIFQLSHTRQADKNAMFSSSWIIRISKLSQDRLTKTQFSLVVGSVGSLNCHKKDWNINPINTSDESKPHTCGIEDFHAINTSIQCHKELPISPK